MSNAYKTAMLRFGHYVHAVERDEKNEYDILVCRKGAGADLRDAPPDRPVNCPDCEAALRGQTRRVR